MPDRPFDEKSIRAMERAAARAWPALETVDIDGWTWRCSGGGTRRANSVLPLDFHAGATPGNYAGDTPGKHAGATPENVDRALDAVETRYRARGLKSYFQVSAIAQPSDLDARLAARGYIFEEPCRLMARRLEPMPMPAHVEVAPAPSDAWLAIYGAELDASRLAAVPDVLARVPAPRAFFLVHRGGEALATALCVVSPDGVAIIECVATRTDRRRAGAAATVMDGLESWAATNGATVAALQVVETNSAARALYAARGYRDVGRYHYRWKTV